jgi:hypothetical protein
MALLTKSMAGYASAPGAGGGTDSAVGDSLMAVMVRLAFIRESPYLPHG